MQIFISSPKILTHLFCPQQRSDIQVKLTVDADAVSAQTTVLLSPKSRPISQATDIPQQLDNRFSYELKQIPVTGDTLTTILTIYIESFHHGRRSTYICSPICRDYFGSPFVMFMVWFKKPQIESSQTATPFHRFSNI